ncbi:T-cell surface glycoprotein CD8 beta chain [Engystomops pustulosus]|uniref:T-cell surface glycoprotein CD8 beta chain n=1 Tax=Engystomops pustulosus TaxID=76066 RepID=UPI003AFADFAA
MKHLGLWRSRIIHCFSLISFYVTGVNSAMLSQVPESTIQLVNGDTDIFCNVRGESIDKLELYWFRRTEEKHNSEFIVSATSQLGKPSYGPNIDPEKFTMKKTSFQDQFFLNIKNLDHTDNGVYYCMAGKSLTYSFGAGTKLTVVDSIPTTMKTTTKKPPCKCRTPKKTPPPGVRCSPVIWAPLAGLALVLLIGLYLLASHTYRVYRRTYMYFRRHSPK